jgi:hypothetical protein
VALENKRKKGIMEVFSSMSRAALQATFHELGSSEHGYRSNHRGDDPNDCDWKFRNHLRTGHCYVMGT